MVNLAKRLEPSGFSDVVWGETMDGTKSHPGSLRLRVRRALLPGLALIALPVAVLALGPHPISRQPQAGRDSVSPVAGRRASEPSPPEDLVTERRGETASCAFRYSVETLRSMAAATAFDGTVSRVDARGVRYRVDEWFRGPGGDSVQLRSPAGFAAANGANGLTEELASAAVGRRYLVVAADETVWGCGFTQPYREAVASAWRQALRPPEPRTTSPAMPSPSAATLTRPLPSGGITKDEAMSIAQKLAPSDAIFESVQAEPFSSVDPRFGGGLFVAPDREVWVVMFAGTAAPCPPGGSTCESPRHGTVAVVIDYLTGHMYVTAGYYPNPNP
jgi:hypothetical protein